MLCRSKKDFLFLNDFLFELAEKPERFNRTEFNSFVEWVRKLRSLPGAKSPPTQWNHSPQILPTWRIALQADKVSSHVATLDFIEIPQSLQRVRAQSPRPDCVVQQSFAESIRLGFAVFGFLLRRFHSPLNLMKLRRRPQKPFKSWTSQKAGR